MVKKNVQLYLVSLVFLISGVAGLVYEIVWERVLEIYFGVTNVSIVLIVSAYMAGLGLGSLFGGQISGRIRQHLWVYGWVEIGIALFGLFSLDLIIWIGSLTAGAHYGLVFLISFLILLLPTFLMGMTLPLLTQAFITKIENAGEIVGLLYGINTLGAALGSFLTGFVLIGRFGLLGAVYIACALNTIVGIAALLGARISDIRDSTQTNSFSTNNPEVPANPALPGYQVILFVSFLVGFLGLGYEMLWMRILNILNKNTVYGFPAVLGVFLTGLALGGYYFGRQADRSRDPYRLFWKLEATIACTSALTILVYMLALDLPFIRDAVHAVFRNAQRPEPGYMLVDKQLVFSIRQWAMGFLSFMLPILWLVLPPSLLMGAGLPILDRIAIRKAESAGARIGTVHLMNILGSVLGAITVSFGLLKWFGTEITLKVLVLLGMTFMLVVPRKALPERTWDWARIFSFVSILVLVLVLPAQGSLYQKYFQVGTNESMPVIREYQDGVLALTSSYLWIRGDEHGSYPSDGVYESIVLPCLGAKQPKRVLVIGLGGGNTLHFLTKVPGIEEIVVVELMEGLDEFITDHVPRIGEILDDPRVTYITDDGRRYLYANPNQKFDLIFTDPLRHYSAGHGNLYSKEAQELYRAHLNENGVYCQWQDENHVIPKTTASVFPAVDVFAFVAVASEQPVRYNLQYMQQVADVYLATHGKDLHPDAGKHLDVFRILQTFSRDHTDIMDGESQTPIITDLNPLLEYYLFRKPIRHPIHRDGATMENFITRVDGCDDVCKSILLERPR